MYTEITTELAQYEPPRLFFANSVKPEICM